MVANDNNNNDNVITPAHLADRRQEFLDELTLSPDETGSYIASNRSFYEIDRDDFTTEHGATKFNSFDVLYGDRSPNFDARDLVVQRDVMYLDPLNRFYAMGMDKQFDLVSQTPLETDNDAPGEMRRLTLERQTSVNINFNLGGYIRESSAYKPRAISVRQAEEWRNSFHPGRQNPSGQENSPVRDQNPAATPGNIGDAKGAYKSLVFAAG